MIYPIKLCSENTYKQHTNHETNMHIYEQQKENKK